MFQHARRLFELARDAPSAPSEAVEPTRVVEPDVETPHGRVSQWLAEGDYLAVAKVLEHDPGSIAQQARMFDVLLAVVRGMGPDLTASQVTAVQRELSHDGLLVCPAEEITLRLAVAESDVVRRLRADAAVPKAFADLVNAAREPAIPPHCLGHEPAGSGAVSAHDVRVGSRFIGGARTRSLPGARRGATTCTTE